MKALFWKNVTFKGNSLAVQKDCSLQGLISCILSLLEELSFLSGVNEISQWLMAPFFLSCGVVLSLRLQYLLSKMQGWAQSKLSSWLLISFPFLQQVLFHLWWIRTLLMHPRASLCKNMNLCSKLQKRKSIIQDGGRDGHDNHKSSCCRFDSEMKRMEEEMNKFRSELINRESSSFRKAGTRFLKNLTFSQTNEKLHIVVVINLINLKSILL